MSEWINVEDANPKYGEEVLMCNSLGTIRVGYILDCGDYIRLCFGETSKEINSWNRKITHWMPLPEPPNKS